MGGSCDVQESKENQSVLGKPEGKRPVGIPRPRREANTKMDLKEMDGRVCIGLMWLMMWKSSGFCERENEHWGSVNCGRCLG
jgi:hypothetical protein